MRRLIALLLVILATSCPSEEPGTASHDAGDHAWAREASLALWGRMPASVHETDMLVAMIEQSDRATVARAMTRTEDYRDRWQVAILDLLGVARQGNAANPGCWDLSLIEDDAPDLARFVGQTGPLEGAFETEFTQLDLVRSALVADDLRPVFRAGLYNLQWTRAPAQSLSEGEGLRRASAEIFQSVYLGRDVSCLGCHNSEFAVTDNEDPALDHHWPLPGLVERAVFGASEGRPLDDLALLFRRRGVEYRHWFSKERSPPEPGEVSLINGCVSSNGGIGCGGCPCEAGVCEQLPQCCTTEWTQECSDLCDDVGDCQLDDQVSGDGCFRIQGLDAGCDGCSCEDFVCDLMPGCCMGPEPGLPAPWTFACAALCSFAPGSECAPHEEATEPVALWGWHASCGQFNPSPEPDITGGEAFLIETFDDTASLHDLERLVRQGMDALGSGPLIPAADGTVDGLEALAWMMATRLSDRVWQKVRGHALTLPHGFSRNPDQLEILEDLTARFTASGWSLSELLVAVVTHPTFNQRAPEDLEDGSPYYLAPVFDPWTVEQDVEEVRGNSLGDVLHRRDGRQLQQMVRKALGWSKPENFFSIVGVSEGNDALDYQIGAFTQQSAPGHGGLGFQALLGWEDTLSACRDPFDRPANPECAVRDDEGCPECFCSEYVCTQKPSCCVDEWGPDCVALCTNMGTGCVDVDRPADFAFQPDWVDALAEAAQGATWGDALRALKERLLGDPTLDPEEGALYEAVIGAGVDDALPADPDAGLRAACGILLSTPQFLLAGDPGPVGALEPAPVYPPGASFVQTCAQFSFALEPGALACFETELTFSP